MPIHVSVGGLEKGENTFLSIFKQFPIRLQCVGTGTARNPLIDLLTLLDDKSLKTVGLYRNCINHQLPVRHTFTDLHIQYSYIGQQTQLVVVQNVKFVCRLYETAIWQCLVPSSRSLECLNTAGGYVRSVPCYVGKLNRHPRNTGLKLT